MVVFAVAAIFIIFLADRLTKKYILENIEEGSYKEIIKDRLYITNIKNKGAAYGLFAKKPRVLLVCTAVSIFWAMLGLYRSIKNKGGFWEILSFISVFGGAAGNVTDRIFLKQVTDFIYIKPKKWKNPPIFNVADVFIFAGALLYIVKDIFLSNKN